MIFVIYYKTTTYMKKKLMLFSMLLYCGLLFISCNDITYNGDDRIVFEGYLKRQDGAAIAGVPVYIYVYGNSDSDNVSYAITDANGHYRMIFPKPTKFDNISLFINRYREIYNEESLGITNNLYSNYTIANILPGDLSSYHMDFGTTVLYSQEETTTLTINFITEGSVGWNFPITGYEGLFADRGTFYNLPHGEYGSYPDEPIYENYESYYPDGLNYYHYYKNPDHTYSRTFNILKNQAFTFKYQNADFETITANIPIADQPVTYTVNY